MTVNVSSSVAIDRINVEFEKQGIFGQGSRGNYGGLGFGGKTGNSWGDKIADRSGGADAVTVGNRRFESRTGNVIYPITQKNDRTVYNQTNRDQVFGDGTTFNNSVGISFGSEKSNTYISFADWKQNGIIRGTSSYNRKNLRLNHSVDMTDKFSVRFNASYMNINSDRIQQGSNLNGLYLGYLRTSPDFDNRDYIGTYYDDNNVPTANSHRAYRRPGGSGAPVYNNPGWTINEQDNPNTVHRFNIAPQLTYKLSENITITGRYGLDYYTDHRETFFPVNSAQGERVGSYRQDDISEKIETFNLFAQGDHTISDNFTFDWVLGTQLDKNVYARMSGYSNQFTNPDLGDLRILEMQMQKTNILNLSSLNLEKWGDMLLPTSIYLISYW